MSTPRITGTDLQAMETDAPNGEGQPKKTRKVKKQVPKDDLPISAGTPSLDESAMHAWTERENAMYMEDKLVAETDEKKNELESSIYELRDKIDTVYAEFSSEEEKEKLKAKLMDTEVISLPTFFSLLYTDLSGLAVRRG